jgi:hypothetical protein
MACRGKLEYMNSPSRTVYCALAVLIIVWENTLSSSVDATITDFIRKSTCIGEYMSNEGVSFKPVSKTCETIAVATFSSDDTSYTFTASWGRRGNLPNMIARLANHNRDSVRHYKPNLDGFALSRQAVCKGLSRGNMTEDCMEVFLVYTLVNAVTARQGRVAGKKLQQELKGMAFSLKETRVAVKEYDIEYKQYLGCKPRKIKVYMMEGRPVIATPFSSVCID